MKPLACRYSIIRFTPFVETGEFANIGIVLTCPRTRYFGFLLQDNRTKRITDFFRGLDRAHYKNAIKAIDGELGRIRAMLLREGAQNDEEAVRGVFDALTRPREALIRFSHPRVLLTDDPKRVLREKFDHYVDHSFATPEYVETTMNARLKVMLATFRLAAPFKPDRLGSVVSAHFDFVQKIDGQPKKIIKALNLTHKDANDLAAHGDVWTGKLGRLQKDGAIPRDMLFNVELADPADAVRHEIGLEVLRELERYDVLVVPGHDNKAIRQIQEFAEA